MTDENEHIKVSEIKMTTSKMTIKYNNNTFKIEKNEMGGACGAYGGGERCAQGSDWET